MGHTSEEKIKYEFSRLKNTFTTKKTRPISFRASELKALRRFLVECKEEICEALSRDLAKPRFESAIHEIGLVLVEIRHALSHLAHWTRLRRVRTPLAQLWSQSGYRYEPKGVSLIIGPWNFPLQLLLNPLVGSIAAGNTAILKPSEFSPHVAKLLAQKLPLYLDAETISVVLGDHETTQTLLKLPFDHIFFTGSTGVGSLVMKEAARNLTPVTLELGGKSPCIVGEEIDLGLAVKRIAWGKFLNCGQVCLAPDFVMLPKSISTQFIALMQREIERFYTKDPRTSKDYGRIVTEKHFQRLSNLLKGEEIVLSGSHDIEAKFFHPTLVLNPEKTSMIMQEEIFGPILPIIEYQSFDEVLEVMSSIPRPLALYAFGLKKSELDLLQESTVSGAFCVNDTISHVAVPNLPFGGVGASGMGTYHGEDSFKAFSYMRAYFKKRTLFDLPLRYPPFTTLYEKIASLFMR